MNGLQIGDAVCLSLGAIKSMKSREAAHKEAVRTGIGHIVSFRKFRGYPSVEVKWGFDDHTWVHPTYLVRATRERKYG